MSSDKRRWDRPFDRRGAPNSPSAKRSFRLKKTNKASAQEKAPLVVSQPAQPRAGDLFRFLNQNWPSIHDHLTASFSPKRKLALAIELRDLIQNIESAIFIAVDLENETEANGLRSAEVLIRSIISELVMWLELADDNGDFAWDHFCSAESRALSCAHWPHSVNLAERRVEHLRVVERVAFPFQPYFFSAGFIATTQSCTICQASYGACSHIAGRLYNGQIAGRRVAEIGELLEMSLVDRPRSKRCRVTSVDGIDPLTGETSRHGVDPGEAINTVAG